MPECKMCGKSGWLLSVSDEGLCGSCYPTYINEVQQRFRIITDCIRLVDESKKTETRLSRCDLLVEHAEELRIYQEKGIPTIKPSPSQLVHDYTRMRDRIILDGVRGAVDKALAKAEVAATAKTSISAANKALLNIQEAREELGDHPVLKQYEARIRGYAQETQLNEYLEKAKKAEFKGDKKKALDQYQEALYFLKTEEIDDSMQDEHIQEIEAKIKELSE
jgi:hypothetical protein